MSNDSSVLRMFSCCVRAMRAGELISRETAKDKEFHFQNWVGLRLADTKFHFEKGGRNSYPDFRLVNFAEG